MPFQVARKFAFVTGGASGIGLSIVKALLKHGAKGVAIVDVNASDGKKLEEELRSNYTKNSCIFIECDVAEPNQLKDAFDLTVEKFKSLDIVVNNAGILPENDWQKSVRVNLGGCILGTKLALEKYLPLHKSGEEGVILNMSSRTAVEPLYSFPIYRATKCGIVGLSQAYGSKGFYEKSNIRVIALCPGTTDTPILQEADPKALAVPQSPDHVAESAITVIQNAASGSVWVVKLDKPAYEIQFPK